MLTEIDIKSIAQSGEGYNAEFKVAVPTKAKEIAGELCAFANAAGGVLLIGIDDNNNIKGVDIDNKKRSAIQNAISQLNPQLHCPFYIVEVDGKQIGVIEIPSGLQKPYTISGVIYIRQGANSQKIISVEQMRDFFQQSGRIYFDEGDCDRFSYEQDFDKEYFKEFRIQAGFSAATDNLQIIKNLQLTNVNGVFKNGSVLFFAKHVEKFFDKAVIRCVAFDGTDKVNIIDDKVMGGPLMQQYNAALRWLKTKLSVRYIIEGGGPRKEVWEIPETALKEAIINALSHRDYYDKGGRIMIEHFDNRVEITNPGGLVSAISPEEFGKKSSSRNPLVFGLFERVNMVEQVGSGINRIKSSLKESGLPAPVFKTEGMFTIVFQKQKEIENTEGFRKDFGKISEGLKEDTLKVLELIKENPRIKSKEIASELNKSSRMIENHIKTLREKMIINRRGPKLGGYWEVLDE
jgi:ATP-dependent DNA helicase RecG